MLFVFSVLVLYICFFSRNLILVLLILEILGFVLIYYIAFYFSGFASRDYLVLLVFSVLVIEGVMALCGLIMLVSFSGRDYLKTRTFLKV